MKRLVLGVAAAALSIGLLAWCGFLYGRSPGELLLILLRGAFGSKYAFHGTLLRSVPLLLTGLSVAVAFRAGVWNIGAEGQFIVGGLAALAGARLGLVAALLASIVAGMLWASIASAMRMWRNAPEVLTTILLNFIAIHLLGYAVNGPMQETASRYPQSAAAVVELPEINDIHAGVFLAVIVAVAVWHLMYRTDEGLRLRATGANASAARWAGINVNAQIVRAMAISGGVAGLAGGIELLGVTHRLFERFAAGYGYSGIAVALLAQLHPLATLASAFFFGALENGAGELQLAGGISPRVATLGEAIVILVIVAIGKRADE
jgi:simple sugar transport system permease protein